MDLVIPEEILNNTFDGVSLVNNQRQIVYWNAGAERITGFSAAEALGRSCSDDLLRHMDESGSGLCPRICPMDQAAANGRRGESLVFLHHKEGHRVPTTMRITPLHDTGGQVVGAAEIFSEATARLIIHRTDILEDLSLVDPLTGLGNRRRATQEFSRWRKKLRRQNTSFGLFFVDIDVFKKINLTYGYAVGDRVMGMVAKTLSNALRGIDILCRSGGDEFVAIVPKVDEATFRGLGERMRLLVETSSLRATEGTIAVTVSVGGALAHADDTFETLAARADAMMFRAKHTDGNCVYVDFS